MNKRAMVTGAGGFIGRYVVRELENIHGCEVIPFKADILDADFDSYMRAERPDYLINLAWVTGSGYLDSPDNLVFLQKGIEMYRAFYANGGRRAVFIGTEQEYARHNTPFCENSPLAPASLYAQCKQSLGSALISESMARLHGFVWGRVFFVHGAGEKTARLMPSIITALRKNEDVTCSYNGFVRDYLYVKDVAGAICHCLMSDFTGAVNIAGGRNTTIGEIAGIISKNIKSAGKVVFKPAGGCGQPPVLCADISLLKSLGWAHRYTLEQGISEQIECHG